MEVTEFWIIQSCILYISLNSHPFLLKIYSEVLIKVYYSNPRHKNYKIFSLIYVAILSYDEAIKYAWGKELTEITLSWIGYLDQK